MSGRDDPIGVVVPPQRPDVVVGGGGGNEQNAAAARHDKNMTTREKQKRKRRNRLELEILEESLHTSMIAKRDRLAASLAQAKTARQNLIPELYALKEKQIALARQKLDHAAKRDELQDQVTTLRARLERWKNSITSSSTTTSRTNNDEDDEDEDDDMAGEDVIAGLEAMTRQAEAEAAEQELLATRQQNGGGGGGMMIATTTTTTVGSSETTTSAATTNNNDDRRRRWDELTMIPPWPTHEMVEKSWAKLPDRFLLHFGHPKHCTDFLYMSWREILSCPVIVSPPPKTKKKTTDDDDGAENHNDNNDDNNEALFRREGLWRTALDVRLLLGPQTADLASASSTTTISADPAAAKKRIVPLLNPDIAMCPFELQGVCADPECSYQHLAARPMQIGGSMILARELLPLPSKKQHTLEPTRHVFKQPLVDNKKNKNKRRRRHRFVTAVSTAAPVKEGGTFANNQDFVRLGVEKEEEEGEESDDDMEEDVDPPLFLWMTEHRSQQQRDDTTKEARPAVTRLEQAYGVLGVTLAHDATTRRSYLDLGHGGASPLQFLTCYSYALHAGRHDHATALVAAYQEWNGNDDYAKLLALQQISLLRDDKTRNVFTRAFEAQLEIALAGAVAEYEYKNEASFKGGKVLLNKITELRLKPPPQRQRPPLGSGEPEGSMAPLIAKVITDEWSNVKHESGGGPDLVQLLIEKTSRGRSLRDDIQRHCSVDEVLATILPAVEMARGAPSRNTQDKADFVSAWSLLTVLPIFAQSVFGMLGCAARQFEESPTASQNMPAFRLLVNKVDVLLDVVRAWAHDTSFQTDFLLAPVYAANIALAATIRQYDKTQNQLERLLCDHHIIGASKFFKRLEGSLMPCSELLWSQLIQLHAALPKRLPASSITLMTNDSLPTEQQEVGKAIEAALCKLGVFPGHVILRNDGTLVRIMNEEKSKADASLNDEESLAYNLWKLHDRLNDDPLQVVSPGDCRIHLSFTAQPLAPIRAYEPSSSLRYAIPQSILLAGHIIESLNLSTTDLTYLHPTFGSYFPNLKVLDVSSNALENLPPSIGRLTSLQSLNVDNNRLSSLPPILLKKLLSLSAAGNKLSTLPASISDCLALTMIDLRDNPLLQSVSIVVSKLPNLVNYKHDEIKTVQKKV